MGSLHYVLVYIMFCCKVCLDTILDLTIQESHGDQEKIRQYSLEELQELMNKLMLMSGKEEQNAQVEKFSEVSFLKQPDAN